MAKAGKTLVELATEIHRQAEAKKDYVAPAGQMIMRVKPGLTKVDTSDLSQTLHTPTSVSLALQGVGDHGLRPLAHGQLAEYVGIPKAYYDRMLNEEPTLLAHNVNRWLDTLGRDEKQDKRLIRTLDGQVRAVLSDRFRPLDNFDLAEAVLPVLLDMKLVITSCEITERRLYIKAFHGDLEREIERSNDPSGAHAFLKDVCAPAISISNSETGGGALSILAGVFTKGCTNLAFWQDASMRKYHTGGRLSAEDNVYALLTDKTKALTDAATWAQVRDVVSGAFEVAKFEARLKPLQLATEQRIEGDIPKVVEVTAKRFGMTKEEGSSILRHLIQGADLTRYGLFNAITRAAEDLPDYDRASDFERFGPAVIELPRGEWQQIAQAA